jgi:ribosome recycling factor
MSDDYKAYEDKMKKSIEVLKAQFASVRAGRANAAVLDQLSVDYYGTPTPINQVASIASPDPRTLMIQPWDKNLLKIIEKALWSPIWALIPRTTESASGWRSHS